MRSGGSSPSHNNVSLARKRSQQGSGSEGEPLGATRAKKRQKPNGNSHLASGEIVDSEASDAEDQSQLVGLEGLDLDLFKKVRPFYSLSGTMYVVED